MQSIKVEASKLIKSHFAELTAMNQSLGGVYIARCDGTVAVVGAQDSEKKIIFQTGFVSENENRVLDAQIAIQDLLEEEGIEAISEHDFNLALENN
jgi:hypothetical protein